MAESDDSGGFRRFRRDSVDALPIGEIGDDRIERTRSWTLDHSADYLSIFAYSAYGQMGLINDAAFPDIGVPFQNVDIYDNQPFTPRGMTIDAPNGTFAFQLEGIYSVSFSYSISHTDIGNAGQSLDFRLFNTVDVVPVPGVVFRIGLARNAVTSTAGGVALFEITQDNADEAFVMQVGNYSGGTLTGVDFTTAILGLWNVGEFRGVLTGSAGGLAILRDL